MLVADLRRRVAEKVEQVALAGDEESIAKVLAYVRAVLIATASRQGDEEVTLQEVKVGTGTAALIMGLHPEYVRLLARRGQLQATKENGEFRILLSGIVNLMAAGIKYQAGPASFSVRMHEMLEEGKGSFFIWRSAREKPEQGQSPA